MILKPQTLREYLKIIAWISIKFMYCNMHRLIKSARQTAHFSLPFASKASEKLKKARTNPWLIKFFSSINLQAHSLSLSLRLSVSLVTVTENPMQSPVAHSRPAIGN